MRHNFLSLASLALLGMSVTANAATIIYSDLFNAADGTDLLGRAPEENNGVSGATYAEHNGGRSGNTNIVGGKARLDTDQGVTLLIDDAGGFTRPTALRVSATIDVGTITGDELYPGTKKERRGVGLGYWESAGGNSVSNDWRGVFLTNTGDLILGRDGVDGSARVGTVATIASGVSTSGTLSFDIDTTTGDISDIVFNTVSYDISTDIFLDSASGINRVGMIVSADIGGQYGYFDNFVASAIPEPSTALFCGLGILLLLRRRRN